MSRDIAFLSLHAAADALARRDVSSVELTQTMLDRISRLDRALGAYISVFADAALAAARKADNESRRGPLHGIPLAVKDLFGWQRTTAGSRSRADAMASQTCPVVTSLQEAGAVLLGKLSTYEFGLGPQLPRSAFPPTRNPWNSSYDTGGSSSGPAAAVAGGLAYGAMGTDTAGSIRWPAFCCGVVGMKPTFGLVNLTGVIPLAWSMDHAGPLTRTVRDSGLMLSACSGGDYCANLGKDIRGLRIGIPRRLFMESCDAEILTAFEAAVARMAALGAEVEDVDAIALSELQAMVWTLMCVEAATWHTPRLKKQPAGYQDNTRRMLSLGFLFSGTAYVQAQRARTEICHKMRDQLRQFDAFMLPTIGIPSQPLAQDAGDLATMAENFPLYMALFNVTGLPSLAVPCGFTANGLPLGFQLATRPFDEATLLQLGDAYEQATPWHAMHPLM